MATPKRRSARLATTKPSSPLSPSRNFAAFAVNKLASLLERDETPTRRQHSLTGVLSSPVRGRDRMPGGFDEDDSVLKTPQTVPPPRPAREEMHPSKAQRRTTEEPDSALRLGFTDIKDRQRAATAPLDDTPSKSAAELQEPGFDFKWRARPDNDAEAQRILDSVRDEAQRIKDEMKAQRDEQVRKDIEAGLISPITGRKFATPKRKAGRFSDAHKAEFSKMPSISEHISVVHDKAKAVTQTLKRTKSKADLGDDSTPSERPENPRAGKRVKTTSRDDVSTAADAPKPALSKTPVSAARALPAAACTPTKSSLARSASMKSIRTAGRIPSLLRAKSAKTVASPTPAVPKSEGSLKYLSALARAPSIKSILHRPQPKYSSDPSKIAAGTHLPMEESTLDPSSPSQLARGPTGRSPVKRVGFDLGDAVKAPTDDPISPPKTLRVVHPEHTSSKLKDPVVYPKLPTTMRPAGGPGDFTFRSPQQPLRFRSAPNTPAMSAPPKTSIRCVRPSGVSTPLAPFGNIPHGIPNKKRRRPDEDDDDDDIENRAPQLDNGAKRIKAAPVTPRRHTIGHKDVRHMDAAEKRKEGVHSASPKKKPVLSLSRLNALARPKHRA